MKKTLTMFLVLTFIMSLLSVNVMASSTQKVTINGIDRLEVTKVAESFEVPPEEGFDSQWEFTCKTGAKLSLLEEDAITLVFQNVHDPVNGSSSSVIAPDGYTDNDLNEYGEFFGLPKGGSYTLAEQGTYYYHITLADNAVCCGYIYVSDAVIPSEGNIAQPPVQQPQEVIPEVEQEAAQPIPVVSKAQCLQIEEEWADVDAYNIYGNNYIKLRDFAYYYSLFGNHTDKYFDVTWDGEKNAINLVRGKAYTQVGGEGALNVGVSAQAVLSSSSVYLNGEHIPLTAYNINGNNYFKLRDLCEALDISISWWPVQQVIYINNDYPYGTEFEEDVPDAF